MKIFGLTGHMGSGKDTLADMLILHGFKKYVYSDVIKEELDKKKMEHTRENLQNMGNILRERHGSDILSRRLYEKICSDGVERVIVVGIRNKGEAEFFKRMDGFKLVWVDAKEKIRMERLIERGLKKDPTNEDQFKKLDKKDLSTGLEEVEKILDVKVENNGTVEDLEEKAKEVFGI